MGTVPVTLQRDLLTSIVRTVSHSFYDTLSGRFGMRRLVEDVAGVLSGALSVAVGMRGSTRSAMRRRAEDLIGRMDLVTREEFEAVKEMAVRAREEQARLADELAAAKASPAPSKSERTVGKSAARKTARASAGSTTSKASKIQGGPTAKASAAGKTVPKKQVKSSAGKSKAAGAAASKTASKKTSSKRAKAQPAVSQSSPKPKTVKSASSSSGSRKSSPSSRAPRRRVRGASS